jgi:D-galactarolactone isomerase
MDSAAVERRRFLKGIGLATLAGAGLLRGGALRAQEAVPNTSGTEPPRLRAPAHACDCHMHIYDPRFTAARPGSRLQSDATAADYRRLQKRIGTTRTVVVTPAAYVTDNRVTLDAIAQLGPDARGIAVVHPEVTDAELKALADGGIRGIRFTVFDPNTAAVRIDMIEPLAERMNAFGWHVQLHMRADQIVDNADMLQRLPCPLVFDHKGRLPPPAGNEHPAFAVLRNLIETGRIWVKLSGAYMDTEIGPPSYSDKTAIAHAYLNLAPERMLWGSDWPHPTERQKPNDAVLFDLLGEWAPDEALRRRILVENPERLYGFAKAG